MAVTRWPCSFNVGCTLASCMKMVALEGLVFCLYTQSEHRALKMHLHKHLHGKTTPALFDEHRFGVSFA